MCALCQIPSAHEMEFRSAVTLLSSPRMILNYIDPGSGYVLGSSIPALLAAILGVLASSLFFMRNKIFPFFTKKRVFVILVLVLIAAGIIGSMSLVGIKKTNKVIILGFDGMDPNILEDGWKKGRYPNLKKIKDTGYFSQLRTTIPPQSPVAWASFITGENPSEHGVYDFIERDPSNYNLNLVFSGKEDNSTSLASTPFWEKTTSNKVPVTVLFLPDTFEPPKSLTGEMIAGMGVPDLLGTQGTFTLFTTKKYPTDDYTWRGKVISLSNPSNGSGKEITTHIEGPKYNGGTDTKVATIPLKIKIIDESTIELNVQNKAFQLKKDDFSEWKKLEFSIDFFTKAKGIAKFYLKSVGPEFELYMSPVNFDPEAPLKPISTPKSFSAKLSKDLGSYSTLGLPHDTWALEEGVFNEEAFLKQAESILSERRKIFALQLKEFKSGLFFAYFGMPDTISHMFWRYRSDPSSKYYDTINQYYDKMDRIVGETLKNIDKDTTFIVLSDHGFYSFDYEINVNTYLMDEGYLVLKEGAAGTGPLYESVDWSRTKAYAAGYNSVYFNVKGREAQGIVEQKDIPALQKELVSSFTNLSNPETGSKVVKHTYTREEMKIKEGNQNAPDLILGFYKGIRSSWDSAIGATTPEMIVKRESKWSGDHLFDPTEVPGVLFSNKKMNLKNPGITDVVAKVLPLIGVSE